MSPGTFGACVVSGIQFMIFCPKIRTRVATVITIGRRNILLLSELFG
uniref:Uncharacterized protein n=1 Tax=Amphimedon queenslandica TaxID=400682 RepID=A0A1X7VBR1_AMPQE